jgi:hypothetical protein
MPVNIVNAIRDQFIQKALAISDYEIQFNLWRFLKIFIYHMLFFSLNIFGALMVVLFENYQFARNLAFVGSIWKILTIQYTQSVCFIAIFLVYFAVGSDVFVISEFIFPVITIIIRSLIIAIKYGLMSNTRYSVLKKKHNFEWMTAELLIIQWQQANFTSIETEIKASKYRMKVEDDDFMFQFIDPLDKVDHEQLSNPDYYKENKLKVSDIVKELKAKKKLTKQEVKEHSKSIASIAQRKENTSNVVSIFPSKTIRESIVATSNVRKILTIM